MVVLVLSKVANGDWVHRTTLERELAQARHETERAQHEANEWRTEGRIKDQAILVELESIKKTGEETGSTVHNFIASLQKVYLGPPPTQQPEQPGGS